MKARTCVLHKTKMLPTSAKYSVGRYTITQLAWRCPKTGHKILEPVEVDESFKKIALLKQSFRLRDLPDRYLSFEGKVVRYFVTTNKPVVTTKDLVEHFSTGNLRSTRALVSRAVNRLVKAGTILEVARSPLDRRQSLYTFANLSEPQRLLKQG